jgi:hypothetical protein
MGQMLKDLGEKKQIIIHLVMEGNKEMVTGRSPFAQREFADSISQPLTPP